MTDEEKVKAKYLGAEYMLTYRGPAIVVMGHRGLIHLGRGQDENAAWADAARKLDGGAK